jgi:hypothetical protein
LSDFATGARNRSLSRSRPKRESGGSFSMLSDEIVCKLCGEGIEETVEGDHWCFGCKSYICGNHIFDPWGGHDPEDHDFVREEE